MSDLIPSQSPAEPSQPRSTRVKTLMSATSGWAERLERSLAAHTQAPRSSRSHTATLSPQG